MIAGGRRKWGVENPSYSIDDAAPPPIELLAWTADRYAGEARPIIWLCRGTIPLGIAALLAAMGGLGKSYIALDLALQVAAGVAGLEQPRKILGGRITVEGTAVVVTAEDSFDAVHRRLNRIDPTARRLRHPQRLIVLPLPDAGGARPLIATNGKTLTRTRFFDDLKQQLLRLAELRLIVIDPLQAFVLADVNADPAAAQFLWSAMAELAAATGATVLLTHHMRKDGMLRIANGDDAREAIRGTTALVDGARLAYALWRLDEETARPLCVTLQIPFTRGCLVRGAVVKANDEADHDAHTAARSRAAPCRFARAVTMVAACAISDSALGLRASRRTRRDLKQCTSRRCAAISAPMPRTSTAVFWRRSPLGANSGAFPMRVCRSAASSDLSPAKVMPTSKP